MTCLLICFLCCCCLNRGLLRRLWWRAETMKQFCMKIDLISQRENVLFLPSNMAAMTSHEMLYRGFSRRPCWRAETMKQFCMKIDLISQRRENVWFLPSNMAAMTSHEMLQSMVSRCWLIWMSHCEPTVIMFCSFISHCYAYECKNQQHKQHCLVPRRLLQCLQY